MNRLVPFLLLLVYLMACETSQIEEVDCTSQGPSLTLASTPSGCDVASGSVTATVSGGTAPFVYAINAVGFADNETGVFEGLSAGNYEVSVFDGNDCTATLAVTVTSADGPAITGTEVTNAGCGQSAGTITVTASGGTGDLTYAILDGPSQASNVLSGLAAGTYELVVSDESGCETIEQVQVLSGVSLADNIQPIINTNCALASCHGGSQSPDLTTLAGIIGSAGRIRARTSAGTMPPSGKLPDDLIEQIACWVEDGAPEN